MMKKIWSVLLSICLILSLAAPALAAPIKTSGAASTLKLESVDGTAKLNNASGKEVKTTKGARLYNGYKLATEKASYAYVSLDDAKAIKLDASSSSEVFQSGKKLELKVTSGQMFFNVTAPLKSDESLNIRTSTMVTGVRGTSGWVSVIDRYTTQISLLEGTLTITSTDPLTGQQRTITIVGGQTATIVYHGKDKNYESEIIIEDKTIQDLIEDGTIRDEHIVLEETGLTVENLQEEDVPGFVAAEVKKDKELQKKIEENSPLSVPAIIGDAEERLEKEEAAAEAADKAIQGEFEKLTADDVDPLFKAETPSGGSSGGGGNSGGNTGGNNTPNDTPETETTAYTMTLITQTYDPNNQSSSNSTTHPAEYCEEGSTYTFEAPGENIIFSVEGVDSYELSNDRKTVSVIMDSDKTMTVSYGPAGDASYSLTLMQSTCAYDQGSNNFVTTEWEENPTILIPAGEYYRLNAPEECIIQTIEEGVAYEIIDNSSAELYPDSSQTVSVTYLSTAVSLDDPITTAQLQTITQYYSDYFDTLGLTADMLPDITLDISGNIAMDGDINTVSFPANYILNLSNATLANDITLDTKDGTQLYVNSGTFENNGTITGQGTLTVSSGATLTNNGTIDILSSNSLHVYGNLKNATQTATINIGDPDGTIPGTLVVEKTGTFTNTGNLYVYPTSSLVVNNSLTNDGSISSSGAVTVAQGATFTNSVSGTIDNSGTFSVASGATMNNAGTLNLNGNGFSCEGTYTDTRSAELMATIKNDSAIIWVGAASALPDTVPSGSEVQLFGAESGTMTNINSTFTLDLNGRQVGSLPNFISFTVQQGLTLTLKDSSGNNSGAFTNHVSNNGTLIVESGTITAASGSALMNTSTGNLIINGGVIGSGTCDYGVRNSNVMTMNSGTVSGTSAGIDSSSGSITIDGGEITGSTGVFLYNGSLTLNSGSIVATSCGIYDSSTTSTTITITGGTIQTERSDISGTIYGIYTRNDGPTSETAGTVINITGGTISASINAGNSYAYGIYCTYNSVPTSVKIGDATYTSTSVGAIQPEGITVTGDDAAVYFMQTN